MLQTLFSPNFTAWNFLFLHWNEDSRIYTKAYLDVKPLLLFLSFLWFIHIVNHKKIHWVMKA